ncbi:MAG TPA: hypothetical protein VGH09_04175 [Solirubrobacteraceae bacterium]
MRVRARWQARRPIAAGSRNRARAARHGCAGGALKSKGSAAAGFALAIVTGLYGTTGYLEAVG